MKTRDQIILNALEKADQRITELCKMVCNLSGNPKKVRPEDWADEIRAALALAKGTNGQQ